MASNKVERNFDRAAGEQGPPNRIGLGSEVARPVEDDMRFPQFMKLPLELRQKIYKIDVSAKSQTVIVRNFSKDPDFPDWIPSICRISKAIRDEAAPVAIAYFLLEVARDGSMINLMRFLKSIPCEQGIKSVRQLSFPLFWRFEGVETRGPIEDFEFMENFPGLTYVKLVMNTATMCKGKPGKGLMRPGNRRDLKTLEELVQDLGFNRIFNSKMLKKVAFYAVDPPNIQTNGKPMGVLDALGKWVVNGFAARGQKVEVEDHYRQGHQRKELETSHNSDDWIQFTDNPNFEEELWAAMSA